MSLNDKNNLIENIKKIFPQENFINELNIINNYFLFLLDFISFFEKRDIKLIDQFLSIEEIKKKLQR